MRDQVFFGEGGKVHVLRVTVGVDGIASWHEAAGIAIAGVVKDLDASDNHLYVADESGALRIIDVTIPNAPVETSHVELPSKIYAVSTSGDHAFLANGWGGILIVDVSDPANPRLVTTYKTPDWLLTSTCRIRLL